MIKLCRQISVFALCLLVNSVFACGQKAILFDSVELPTLAESAAPVAPVVPAKQKIAAANLETQILSEINFLRSNPALYAARLAEYRRYFVGKELRLPGQTAILTDEGVAAVDEAIAVLQRAEPTNGFTLDKTLDRAALDHVRDIVSSDKIGHYDSAGDSPVERVLRYGMWSGELQEMISYYSPNARQIVFSLLVDDGVKSRGHRSALLKSNLKFVGIKTGDSPRYGKLCVIVMTEFFVANS